MRAWSIYLAGAFLLQSCQTYETGYINPHIHGNHLTLPGYAPIPVAPSEHDIAFEQATQNSSSTQLVHAESTPSSQTAYAWMPQDQVSSQPLGDTSTSSLMEQPSYDENSGPMDYTVKINNTTGSRLFIEAQDAKGTIYPCGFTQPKQAFTVPVKQGAPIASPILVVLRDPDQPGAPEIRRYRIKTPTASYHDKTVQISILSGGRYTADIDGEVYLMNNPQD